MKKNGFTLIELMIIVAIVGILAAIAVPAWVKMKQVRIEQKALSGHELTEKEQEFMKDRKVIIQNRNKEIAASIAQGITLTAEELDYYSKLENKRSIDILVSKYKSTLGK